MVISHFPFTKRSVVIFYDVLIDTYHISTINSNIQIKFISPISSISSVPYMNIPYSLISTHIPTLLLTSRCIKLLVSVRLNLMIRTYLVDPYNYSPILSDTDITGVSLVTSVKGLELFPLLVSILLPEKHPFSVHLRASACY